jgi:C-terminal processing protease CtpA/Prc
VTARKNHPNDKVGLGLKEEEYTGRYIVSHIDSDGIFSETLVQIGDVVLSMNGKTVKESFMNELLEASDEAEEKVTIVIRQRDSSKRKERRITSPPRKTFKTVARSNEITAEKDGATDVGIRFIVNEKQLIVKEIQKDSIFKDTKLRVGDCIAKINEMDFWEYADADYALKIANKKEAKTVTLKLSKKN